MFIIESGGGMNKVTLDGKPPKDRINLNEKLLTTLLANYKGPSISYAIGLEYSSNADEYLLLVGRDFLYKLVFEPPFIEPIKECSAPTYSLVTKVFTRKGDFYVLSDRSIYKYNYNEKNFTNIENNLTDQFYGATACFYNSKKDELISIDNGQVRKYSFESKTATIISNNAPKFYKLTILKDEKLYLLGLETNEKEIVTIDINTGLITNSVNALPYPIASPARIFLLDNKIHILGLNDGGNGKYCIFREKESINNWEKYGVFSNEINENTFITSKNNMKGVEIINIATNYTCYNSYEIKKAYVKE